ncbi:hypothetical protein MKK55_04540 [Methylobacterium sp. J-059]|uniref:hypothetical protein n=1 Tax=Methylobacterium sp. J-059 TaxID=2836643 RepID=UPI001FBA89CF|nr:hypothetical protein [Methylobacterium sp. J-059]MCJ2038227.1 hypothetical protein [Methylobacterium sp. J-059]
MKPVKRFPFGYLSALDASNQGDAVGTHITKVLPLVSHFDSVGTEITSDPRSPPEDWSKLIERVRQAAQHARDIEAQAQEQELRVQALLDRVRQDVRDAAERVRDAEARSADIQSRADALLKAADEKLLAAEERARISEEWLARVQETIVAEFSEKPALKHVI